MDKKYNYVANYAYLKGLPDGNEFEENVKKYRESFTITLTTNKFNFYIAYILSNKTE